MPKTLPGMLVMIGCQGAELACFLTDGVASCSRHFGCDSVLLGDLDHLNKSYGGHSGEDGSSAMLCSMAGSSTAQHGHMVCRFSLTGSRGVDILSSVCRYSGRYTLVAAGVLERLKHLSLTSRMARQATNRRQGSLGSRIAERRE